MVNLTCPCLWILVCRYEAKKWVPLWVNLWAKPANRYESYEIRGGGDGSRRSNVGAGNRVRSHHRRQHGGYYTSVTPPSKLQKFYKTQRSSRDYVPRDLWPGLCYCANRLLKRLYCARAKQSAPISNPLRMAQDTGSRLSSWLRNCGTIRNNGNWISRKIVWVNNCFTLKSSDISLVSIELFGLTLGFVLKEIV